MITLQELFNDLAYGEFANLSIGNSTLGTLQEAQYPKIVSAVNLGLIELYKRFPLKEKNFIIHQISGVSTYYLRSDYMGAADSMSATAYIEEDADQPFEDDLLKVTDLYDADGEEYPLNDSNYRSTGAFTTSPDVLEMEPQDPLEVLKVVYRASYPKIVVETGFDPEEVYLYFPDYIRPALLCFIASRVFKGKTSKAAEGEAQISNTFLIQFENACKQIKEDNMISIVNDTQTRFDKGGWV